MSDNLSRPNGGKIRVVIADDHMPIRSAVRRFLSRASHIEVIGEAHNGVEAVRIVMLHQPDVLILDLIMPEMDGFEVLHLLRALNSPVCTLVLSADMDPHLVRAVYAAGAKGYLAKEDAPTHLISTIERVLQA